jgi:hypothetical protein
MRCEITDCLRPASYPATVLPWQRLVDDGVRVRAVHPADGLLSADAVRAVPSGQLWVFPGVARSVILG